MTDDVLGQCELFEEVQVGGERYCLLFPYVGYVCTQRYFDSDVFVSSRYNFFRGCPKAKTCTIILRGGAEQFMEETERSLHDAIMIVRRAIKVGELLQLLHDAFLCIGKVLDEVNIFPQYHRMTPLWLEVVL